MPGFIHHIEWCVSDLAKHERELVDCYGFQVISQRELKSQPDQETVLIRQTVLRSGLTVFMLTENNCHDPISRRDEEGYPYLTCCATRSDHKRDTVFNVCLQVGNVEKVTAKVLEVSLQQATDSGGATQGSSLGEDVVVISPVNLLGGSFTYAVVRSCCGNVIHSLISSSEERGVGDFLPGFRDVGTTTCSDPLTTHMDHVTYVCNTGETRSILNWYSACFGMERFLINSQETLEDDGVEIGEEVGMRMTVGEWISSWLCREVGVQLDPETTDDRMNFKLVIAEPLKGRQDSHVQQFIDSHYGPGLQHIGLSVKEDVSGVVGVMMTKGAKFRKPPPAYYQLENKAFEIVHAGEDVKEFKNLGILIDAEADFCKATQTSSANYLMQIFTRPLFDQNTFFLEILERRGARGFGAGNIRALAKSIIMQQELEQQAASFV